MRRLALLTTAVLLVMELPALAKMPAFETEVESRGEAVHVEVRISGDESMINDFDPSNLDGLLAILPADQATPEWFEGSSVCWESRVARADAGDRLSHLR